MGVHKSAGYVDYLMNAMKGNRPPWFVVTSEHALTARGTGHGSLPRAREAREAEAMYHQWAMAGKERAMAELLVEKGADGVVQVQRDE
jgi:hypothetical protein